MIQNIINVSHKTLIPKYLGKYASHMGSILKSQNPGPTRNLLNLDIQVLQVALTTAYSLKAVFLKFCPQLQLWEWWMESTFQGQGQG